MDLERIGMVSIVLSKSRIITIWFILFVLVFFSSGCVGENGRFYGESLNGSVERIGDAFWNERSIRFIYAPAFDFKDFERAGCYRFTCQYEKVRDEYDVSYQIDLKGEKTNFAVEDKKYVFEAESPRAALSPIWKDMPVGMVKLKVEPLDKKGGKVIGDAQMRRFYRAAVFDGPYHQPVMGYKESARVALKKVFEREFVRSWLTTGEPDLKGYSLYRYPAKMQGALMVGAAAYYNLSPHSDDAEQVLKIGIKAADRLLRISVGEGSALEYFPPTYHDMKQTGHMETGRNMMIYPADAGHGYLDLYEITKDKKYFEAAKRIAETYVKNQLDNGTWYLLVHNDTGQPAAKNLCIPTAIINYLNRWVDDYGVSEYKTAVEKAVKWIMENPVRTFNWQAQFEDSGPQPAYRNMAREQACDFAIYLLDRGKRDSDKIKLAYELMRFAEDQFVIWERPIKVCYMNKGNPSNLWITPCVQEQYGYWQPVIRSAGIMVRTYQKAYEVTGKEIYLAKAKSIANAITITQKTRNGRYPTYQTTAKMDFWINNVVWTATDMIRLGEMVDGKN